MKYIKNRNSFLFEQEFQSRDLSTTYTKGNEPKPVSGQTYNLPYKVSWSFEGPGADNLHSFQSNSSGDNVGNMNLVVQNWLIHFYNQGINPEVSLVDIKINGNIVSWNVTISESKDGNAWVGFTSRGRGEANDMQGAYDNTYSEQDDKTAKKGIKKLTNSKGEMKGIPTTGGTKSPRKGKWDDEPYFRWVDPKDSTGGKGMVQFFVKYTNPTKYPPHSKSAGGSSTSSSSTGSSAGGSKLPTGQVLKVKDVKNLKVGDVLVGTRMTGVNNDVTEPGLYELKVSRNPELDIKTIACDVEIDGEKKGLFLSWPSKEISGMTNKKEEGGEDNDPLVLRHNTETGYFVNLRMK